MQRSDALSSTHDLSRFRFVIASAVILLLALALRGHRLLARELWLDESCTFHWVHHFFSTGDNQLTPWNEPAHVPYYLLLRLWTRIAGETEWGLRSFSLLAGCAGVAAIGWCARMIGSRCMALAAMLLATVHPLHIHYSQEARCYAFWILTIALSTGFLIRATVSASLGRWLIYAASAVVALLTHYYTLFWLPATLSTWWLIRVRFHAPEQNLTPTTRANFLRHWLLAHAVIAAAIVVPVFRWMIPYLQTGPADWQASTWQSYPPVMAIVRSLWCLLPSGGYPAQYLGPLARAFDNWAGTGWVALGHVGRWGAVVAVVALCLIRVIAGASSKKSGNSNHGGELPEPYSAREVRSLYFLGCMTLLPLLLMFVASLVLGRGYIVGRYDLFSLPAAVLLIAYLLFGGNSSGRRWPMTILVFLCGTSLITVSGNRLADPEISAFERANCVAKHVAPEDTLVSVGMYRWFMDYEWSAIGFHPRVRSFPAAHDHQMCWRNVEQERRDADLPVEAKRLAEELARYVQSGKKVWFVGSVDMPAPSWAVDSLLFVALSDYGLVIEPVDEWAGLGRVVLNSAQ